MLLIFTKKLIRFRNLLIILFTGCLVLFSPLFSAYFKADATTLSTKLPAAYVGVWEGNGVQDDNGSQWSILVALTPGRVNSVIGTMAYPSLSCGGELTLRRVNTQSIKLFENLTYLGDNCIGGGTVALELLSNSQLKFKWFYPNGKPGATGSVQKVENKI
jgi:hypothetical protein